MPQSRFRHANSRRAIPERCLSVNGEWKNTTPTTGCTQPTFYGHSLNVCRQVPTQGAFKNRSGSEQKFKIRTFYLTNKDSNGFGGRYMYKEKKLRNNKKLLPNFFARVRLLFPHCCRSVFRENRKCGVGQRLEPKTVFQQYITQCTIMLC